MISRIDHVSLAVKNYEKAVEFFTKILGAIPQTNGDDNSLNYFWQIFALGDLSRLEIIKPIDDESYLKNFLTKKEEGGLHHITLQTPDIIKMKEFLDNNNILYFGYRASDNWKELFIHPKDAFGVLLQIAEFEADDWLTTPHKMIEKKWELMEEKGHYNLNFRHPGGGQMKIGMKKEEIEQLIGDLKKLIGNE